GARPFQPEPVEHVSQDALEGCRLDVVDGCYLAALPHQPERSAYDDTHVPKTGKGPPDQPPVVGLVRWKTFERTVVVVEPDVARPVVEAGQQARNEVEEQPRQGQDHAGAVVCPRNEKRMGAVVEPGDDQAINRERTQNDQAVEEYRGR